MAKLMKMRTMAISSDEVDFKVLEFRSLDNTMLSNLGKHCKLNRWKVGVGDCNKPLDIQLHIDRSVTGRCDVGIVCGEKQVFPFPDDRGRLADKGIMKQDFVWRYPFRGTVKGLGKEKMFEVRPPNQGGERWYPATLKEQLPDGHFQAMVFMPDLLHGERPVFFPLVNKANIRAATTERPVQIPERHLILSVPKEDPLAATLTIDDELITHFFGRPTPAPARSGKEQKSRVLFQVSQDRSTVHADVSFATLQHFLTGDVQALASVAARQRHEWCIQVGPFAEHKIELSRQSRVGLPSSGKVLTLKVDGEVLVMATAEDIDCKPDNWTCTFRLVGEKYLDWDVHECDLEGNGLDSKGLVTQKSKYTHELVVNFNPIDTSLQSATLSIDGKPFESLVEYKGLDKSEQLSCPPESLYGTYGLLTPWKLTEQPPGGCDQLEKVMDSLWADPIVFLSKCCGVSTAPPQPAKDTPKPASSSTTTLSSGKASPKRKAQIRDG
mmetsp:Transcript_17018/g.36918  ORF Transcript_17018/g.36918 Transcript_17018/m.36918 type:complete len:495 (+) Transcript_17018:78-1562(+)